MTLRSYSVWMIGWFVLYATLLVVSIRLLDQGFIEGTLPRTALALLPMLPGVGILFCIMRGFRAMDEMQQRIQADGIMFAFAATALLTFSYGFLERFISAPMISYFYVWPVLGTTWVIGTLAARLRYR